jgi:hypothetical protein
MSLVLEHDFTIKHANGLYAYRISITKNEHYNYILKCTNDKTHEQLLNEEGYNFITNIPYIPESILEIIKFIGTYEDSYNIKSIHDNIKNILTITLKNDFNIINTYYTKTTMCNLKTIRNLLAETNNKLKVAKNTLKSSNKDLLEIETKLKIKNKLLAETDNTLKSANINLLETENKFKTIKIDLVETENKLKTIKHDLVESQNKLKAMKNKIKETKNNFVLNILSIVIALLIYKLFMY